MIIKESLEGNFITAVKYLIKAHIRPHWSFIDKGGVIRCQCRRILYIFTGSDIIYFVYKKLNIKLSRTINNKIIDECVTPRN